MIIDAHNHPDWHGRNPARFLKNMSGYKIDKTWLLSWEAPKDECDPGRPEAIEQLEAAIEIHSVRVYGELKLRMMSDNPDALRMFRFCGKKGMPVIVHIDYEFDTGVKYPRPNWWYGGGIDSKDFLLEFRNRLLYGRDCFDNFHQEFLNSPDLAEDVLAGIYSGNALKLVRCRQQVKDTPAESLPLPARQENRNFLNEAANTGRPLG